MDCGQLGNDSDLRCSGWDGNLHSPVFDPAEKAREILLRLSLRPLRHARLLPFSTITTARGRSPDLRPRGQNYRRLSYFFH